VWPWPTGGPSAAGYMLQGADAMDSTWATIPGATSPHLVPADAARKFYRLSRE